MCSTLAVLYEAPSSDRMPIRLPAMDPCYFCEIVDGRVDRWSLVEETPLTLTLLNGRQYEAGQCVVLPRRHAPTLVDLRDTEGAAIIAAAQRLARAMVAAWDPDGVLLYQNNGIGSAQEVPHFHLHVVPRRTGSDWGVGPPHLAHLQQRASHLDHTIVTPQKRQAAGVLRRLLAVSRG